MKFKDSELIRQGYGEKDRARGRAASADAFDFSQEALDKREAAKRKKTGGDMDFFEDPSVIEAFKELDRKLTALLGGKRG